MKYQFSLVIATQNRPQSLERLLQSLAKIEYDDTFEILVIENGPSSTSKEICHNLKRLIKSLQYHYLEKSGLSSARNYGIQQSKFPYIIVLDDDTEIMSSFFLSAYRKAWKKYPLDAIIGGGIQIKKESGKHFSKAEEELIQKHGWCFSSQPIPIQDREIKFGELLFGANISFARIGHRFNSKLGLGVPVQEGARLGGEDYELCSIELLKGKKIHLISDSNLAVSHSVDQKRFSGHYIEYRYQNAGKEIFFLEKELRKKFSDCNSIFSKLFIEDWAHFFVHPLKRRMLLSYLTQKILHATNSQ